MPCEHAGLQTGARSIQSGLASGATSIQRGLQTVQRGPRNLQAILVRVQQQIEQQRMAALLEVRGSWWWCGAGWGGVGRQQSTLQLVSMCHCKQPLRPSLCSTACSKCLQTASLPAPLLRPVTAALGCCCSSPAAAAGAARRAGGCSGGGPVLRGLAAGAAQPAVDGAAGAPRAGVRIPGGWVGG